jgi:hypothetical protein
MIHDGFFHFTRPHLETARLDEFLLAVNDVEVTVFVHAGDVAGEEPDLAIFSTCAGSWLFRWACCDSPSSPADRDEGSRRSRPAASSVSPSSRLMSFIPHRARAYRWSRSCFRRLQGIASDGGRRFRQSVAFEDLAAGQFLELFLCLAHQRSRTGDTSFDGRKVIFASLHIGMIVDAVIQSRHAGEDGRLVFADVIQHIFQITRIGHHHHRRARCHGKVHARHHAIHMEERNAHQHHFFAFFQARSSTNLIWSVLATTLRCMATAPFGTPVVPPEYWNKAVSSGIINCGWENRRCFCRASPASTHRRFKLLHAVRLSFLAAG